MKNIQDIIKEMEKISEQVATTVNSDDTPLTPENAEDQLSDIIDNTPAAIGDPVIGTTSGVIPVSNAFTIPTVSDTDLAIPATNLNLMYTTTELFATVNPITVTCTPPDCPAGAIEVTAYEVRLIGALPYIIDIANITGPILIPPVTFESTPGATAVAYPATYPVNKRLGIYPTQDAANTIANSAGLLSITNITATYSAEKTFIGADSSQAIQFTVTFNSIIGNCP